MKRYCRALILLAAVLVTGSCGQKKIESPDALINAVVSDAASASSETAGEANTAPAQTKAPAYDSGQSGNASGSSSVDIDMTKMSATMIYATVNDMLTAPESYYGKSVCVDGYFDTGYDEALGARYFFVVIPDATACCLQGMEFRRSDDSTDLADYPEVKDDIRISGTYDRYEENGNLYYYIKADEVTVL